ncbi:hypothetical protein V5799_008046 [Amblyomma americanum]|uniref:Uncharacterized protein n=1 Tax=Amblyomma americanum TaxID=6943 RepID=A0AAQ4FFT9_AMBAM
MHEKEKKFSSARSAFPCASLRVFESCLKGYCVGGPHYTANHVSMHRRGGGYQPTRGGGYPPHYQGGGYRPRPEPGQYPPRSHPYGATDASSVAAAERQPLDKEPEGKSKASCVSCLASSSLCWLRCATPCSISLQSHCCPYFENATDRSSNDSDNSSDTCNRDNHHGPDHQHCDLGNQDHSQNQSQHRNQYHHQIHNHIHNQFQNQSQYSSQYSNQYSSQYSSQYSNQYRSQYHRQCHYQFHRYDPIHVCNRDCDLYDWAGCHHTSYYDWKRTCPINYTPNHSAALVDVQSAMGRAKVEQYWTTKKIYHYAVFDIYFLQGRGDPVVGLKEAFDLLKYCMVREDYQNVGLALFEVECEDWRHACSNHTMALSGTDRFRDVTAYFASLANVSSSSVICM